MLDVDDNKRLLYEDPEFGCYHPIPLRPTPVPTPIPSRVEAPAVPPTSTDENPQGTFLLADVYRELSVKAGNDCTMVSYEGQGHGFFNFGRSENKYFVSTVRALDRFLASLGYLEGDASIDVWLKEHEQD